MKEKVYKYLNKRNIEFEVFEHPPLYTCADNEKYNLKFDGILCKNLFLKNKEKSKYYLVSMSVDNKINLKELSELLGERKITFASEEDLFRKLKVRTGAVSFLNIVEADPNIVFIIDKSLLKKDKVGFHPNDNTITIFFDGKELENIVNDFNYESMYIDF